MGHGTMDIRIILEMISRRRKVIYRVLAVAVVFATIYSFLAAPVYQATAKVHVTIAGTNEMVGTMGQSRYEDPQIKLLTTAEIVKSEAVLQAVVDELYAEIPKEMRPLPAGIGRRVVVMPVKGTSMLSISVMSGTPEGAQKLANTLVKVFIRRMAELAQASGKDARSFIGERMTEAKRKLDMIEKELVAYKIDKRTITVSDQTKTYTESQSALKRMEVENQLATNAAQAKLADVTSQLARQNPGFVADSPLINQYKTKLADQESELIVAKSKYTDIHPKVAGLTAAVNETRAKLNAEIARVARAEAPSSNGVYQAMLQAKIQAETELAVARAQGQALSDAARQSEKDIKVIPEREQGLARLMREYAVAEEAYTSLAKRYEQARIDEVMQPSNVQIVDLAELPFAPIRPRPVLNVIVSVVLGLFGGVVMALVLDYFRKTIDNAEDVKRYLGIRVIGSIPSYKPYTSKKKASWWRKLIPGWGTKAKGAYNG